MTRFRPTLVPTLVTLPALVALLALGTWQLHRLAWKEALIAERESQLAAPPLPLPAFEGAPPASLAHRRVRLSGRFLSDKSLFYGSRVVREAPGVEILTPLRLADGRIIMVNRGWVPLDRKAPESRPESLPQGRVEVTGILRPSLKQGGWFTPDADLAEGHWYFYDTAGMARYLGLDLLPAVVEALPGAEPGRLPVAREGKVELVNNHLQYALTWYALALALLVIYVRYHLKRTP